MNEVDRQCELDRVVDPTGCQERPLSCSDAEAEGPCRSPLQARFGERRRKQSGVSLDAEPCAARHERLDRSRRAEVPSVETREFCPDQAVTISGHAVPTHVRAQHSADHATFAHTNVSCFHAGPDRAVMGSTDIARGVHRSAAEAELTCTAGEKQSPQGQAETTGTPTQRTQTRRVRLLSPHRVPPYLNASLIRLQLVSTVAVAPHPRPRAPMSCPHGLAPGRHGDAPSSV